MTNFDLSSIPVAPPPPPIDPLVAREEKISNDTRVESELNRFIVAKQDALFAAPDAYYRKQGRDAVDSAPQAIQRLHEMKDALLDGLANDYQRKRLGAALDAQMTLAGGDIGRHATEQGKVWQRQIALDRIDLLAKEAALHHNDDDLIDVLGIAAGSAARAHARVGDGPVDPDRENAAAASARSRIASSAIQARFDSGDAQGATALFDRTRDLLHPAHAELLQPQVLAAGKAFEPSDRDHEVAPTLPDAPAAEVLSDADPEPPLPDRQYAQAGGGRPPNRSGRAFGSEAAEQNAETRAANFQSHLEAIRKLDPNNRELSYIAPKEWVPTQRDVARVHEELLRVREEKRGELLPDRNTLEGGPYAGESISARSSKRGFTVQERAEINRIGSETGCHTCGTREPGTTLGNFVPDHQLPSRLNPEGRAQRLFPQCLSCSVRQGGEVSREVKKGNDSD
jgi:hypothetical protein